jgi:hypothetical protein
MTWGQTFFFWLVVLPCCCCCITFALIAHCCGCCKGKGQENTVNPEAEVDAVEMDDADKPETVVVDNTNMGQTQEQMAE